MYRREVEVLYPDVEEVKDLEGVKGVDVDVGMKK